MSGEDLLFSTFDYHLDESDPDVAILCRQDGSFVAQNRLAPERDPFAGARGRDYLGGLMHAGPRPKVPFPCVGRAACRHARRVG